MIVTKHFSGVFNTNFPLTGSLPGTWCTLRTPVSIMNMVGVRLSVANFKLGIFISLFVPDLLDAAAAVEVVNDCVVTAVAVEVVEGLAVVDECVVVTFAAVDSFSAGVGVDVVNGFADVALSKVSES